MFQELMFERRNIFDCLLNQGQVVGRWRSRAQNLESESSRSESEQFVARRAATELGTIWGTSKHKYPKVRVGLKKRIKKKNRIEK